MSSMIQKAVNHIINLHLATKHCAWGAEGEGVVPWQVLNVKWLQADFLQAHSPALGALELHCNIPIMVLVSYSSKHSYSFVRPMNAQTRSWWSYLLIQTFGFSTEQTHFYWVKYYRNLVMMTLPVIGKVSVVKCPHKQLQYCRINVLV